jgi:hypothetical protein
MTVTCPENDTTGICSTLEGTGAGLGVFFQYLGASLPSFILILAVIGGVVAVFYGIASVIKGSLNVRHR